MREYADVLPIVAVGAFAVYALTRGVKTEPGIEETTAEVALPPYYMRYNYTGESNNTYVQPGSPAEGDYVATDRALISLLSRYQDGYDFQVTEAVNDVMQS